MRLKSEMWVRAYLRSAQARGASVAVVRHGDDDAGAIFVKVVAADGVSALFGPAVSALADDGGRLFTAIEPPGRKSEAEIDAYLSRQFEFDGDLWVIEVWDREGRHHLEDWLAREAP